MSSCTKCQSLVKSAPDDTHRYCPHCGAARVLPDPPTAGRGGGFLVIGRDAIGPHSGDPYNYRGANDPPSRVDPLTGPFESDGNGWRDLFACSDTPLPESAWHVMCLPEGRPSPHLDSPKSLAPELGDAALRHKRLFALANSGQLMAMDTETMALARSWSFPSWSRVHPSTRLRVSESLVYFPIAMGGKTQLAAVDTGKGQTRINLTLACRNPQTLIAGDRLLVVGDAQHGQQPMHLYALSDFAESQEPKPLRSFSMGVAGDGTQACPRPARLGADFVVAASSGFLYGWRAEGDQGPYPLWSNPIAGRLRVEWIALGREEIGFIVDVLNPGGTVNETSVVRIQRAESGGVEMAEVVALPFPVGTESRALAGYDGTLYLVMRQPGQSVEVHAVPLSKGGVGLPVNTLLTTLAGRATAEILGAQVVPWQGEPHVLIHLREGQMQEFCLVHAETGQASSAGGQPLASHRIKVVWETGQVWLVNLTEGWISAFA